MITVALAPTRALAGCVSGRRSRLVAYSAKQIRRAHLVQGCTEDNSNADVRQGVARLVEASDSGLSRMDSTGTPDAIRTRLGPLGIEIQTGFRPATDETLVNWISTILEGGLVRRQPVLSDPSDLFPPFLHELRALYERGAEN